MAGSLPSVHVYIGPAFPIAAPRIGAHKGGFPVAKAEPGAPVKFAGADFLRVENGKVVEYWLSSNQLDLMTQLGMLG
jgi:hypothetical protein